MTYSNSMIETLFHRVLRQATGFGLEADWQLIHGTERQGAIPRKPWRVTESELVLFDLGFTRRTAYEHLTTISAVFDYLLTTSDWQEEEPS